VNACCAAKAAAAAKRLTNAREKSTVTDSAGWTRKMVKRKPRVTSNAVDVMKMPNDPFSALGALEAEAEKKRCAHEKKLAKKKTAQEKKLQAAVSAKRAPSAVATPVIAPVQSGWIKAVMKKKAPVKKECPENEAQKKTFVPAYQKGSVKTFTEMRQLFSTKSWGDESDDKR
jgi:hypothetical protein